MGHVTNLIRNNLFWVGAILVLIVLGVAYALSVNPLSREVAGLRDQSRQNIGDLKIWADKPSIPGPAMIQAAVDDAKDLRTLYGELVTAFAGRDSSLDKPFDVFQGRSIEDFPADVALNWWREYERRTKELQADTEARLGAPPNVMVFETSPVNVTGGRDQLPHIRTLERQYWILKAAVDALANVGAPEKPAVRKLVALRIMGAVAGTARNDWVRTTRITLSAVMDYPDLPLLVASLQNSAIPFTVQGFSLMRAAEDESIALNLTCDLIEFRQAVQSASFSGLAFKDSTEVKNWLRAEEVALSTALQVLAARMPELKARVDLVGGEGLLDRLRQDAEKRLNADLEQMQREAADSLQRMIEAKKKEQKGEIPADEEKRLTEENAKALAKRLAERKVRFDFDIAVLPVEAGGFSAVYDYLHPLVPQSVYRLAAVASTRVSAAEAGPGKVPLKNYLLVARSPGDRVPARWWFASYDGGTLYGPKNKDGTQVTWEQVSDWLARNKGQGEPLLESVVLEPPESDKHLQTKNQLTLFLDKQTWQVVYVLLREGDQWRECPLLTAAGAPVSLADPTFRFSSVVIQSATHMDQLPDRSPDTTIRITPDFRLANPGKVTDFEVPVAGAAAGVIKVKAGPLK